MKIKTKRIFCFLAAFIMSALVLVLPCFAWQAPLISPPQDEQYQYWYTYNNQIVCMGFSYDGSTYDIAIDFSIVGDSSPSDWSYSGVGINHPGESTALTMTTNYFNSVVNGFEQEVDLTPYKQHIINTTLEDLRYLVSYLNTTSQGQAIVNESIPSFNYQEQVNAINSQTTLSGLFVLDSSYSTSLVYLAADTFDRYMEIVSQPTYQDGYTVGYEQGFIAGEQSTNSYQNGFVAGEVQGYENGYTVGYDNGYEQGGLDIGGSMYDNGYLNGYNDGAKDSQYMKNTLVTIFSSPYYILNEVFNFEIFGLNVASVIMFIISIIIVGFVIKIIV